MVVAYALVEADTSDTSGLVAEVTDIEGVKGAHVVAGDIDLIAQVEVPNPGSVSQIITGEIAAFDAVADTETYMSMDK
ncbi:Lrp/AsnC ligand binding domain-containing protein [Halodesulfurarchaeum sp.]|uniref:Lrp/AsnC ligand binding domain-containing protein n=1 Tax=Halodesulfurarchaeum sp. TaxID=1980530 RepID=UPI001BBD1E19|nr:Lrp/AsnC ligand binding domain-containing protein [Halodesulfurarchaeum sp.]